ncbi:MFS transporter [Paenibacillus rhizoplanae]
MWGALVLLYALDFNPWLLTFGYALIGLTEGPIITLVNTIITDKVIKINPMEMGAALGTFRTLQGVGIALGSTLGGFFYSRIGTHPSYLVAAGLMVLTLLISLSLGKKEKKQASPNINLRDKGCSMNQVYTKNSGPYGRGAGGSFQRRTDACAGESGDCRVYPADYGPCPAPAGRRDQGASS